MPPYPRRLINGGETVVLDLKPHWSFFWKHIVFGSALLVIFLLWIGRLNGADTDWIGWLFVIAFLVFAVWAVVKYLAWTYTHFVVTDHRVISRSGIVSKRGTEIPLERVNNIEFRQSLFLRVIGAGDLGRVRPDSQAGGSSRPGSHHARGVRGQEGRAARADVVAPACGSCRSSRRRRRRWLRWVSRRWGAPVSVSSRRSRPTGAPRTPRSSRSSISRRTWWS